MHSKQMLFKNIRTNNKQKYICTTTHDTLKYALRYLPIWPATIRSWTLTTITKHKIKNRLTIKTKQKYILIDYGKTTHLFLKSL